MHLQVTTLAEITDHTGTNLLPQAFIQPTDDKPAGLDDISQSLLTWPNTHPLSRKCWRLWTRTICSLFTGTVNGRKLNHPLGPWKMTYQTMRWWKWRISPLGSLLYQQKQNISTRAAIQTQINRRYATFSTTIPTNQSFLGDPVTPSDKQHKRIDFPIATLEKPTLLEPPTQYFRSLTQQFRSHLLQWQWPMFGPICRLQRTQRLYQLNTTEQPIAIVSDASLQKDHRSGFAWIITNNDQPLWRGVGLAPGHADDMHSGRAEAFGVLAALTFLRYYVQSYGPHLFSQSTIQCYCDNQGVVTTASDLRTATII